MTTTRLPRSHYWILASFLLLTLFAAASIHAQEPPREITYRYRVTVPEALIKSPTEAPQACTVRAGDPARDYIDGPAKNRFDSVWVQVVRVEGTTVTTVKPSVDVDVYLGARRRTLTTSMDSVSHTAAPRTLPDQRVTVQEPNTGRVFCSVTLPGPTAAEARTPAPARREAEAVVSIGASFDLLDGLRANNLYSDARVFAPRLWNGWGVQAGIYQGRESAKGSITGDTLGRRFTFQSPVLPLDTVGGLLVHHRTYVRNELRNQNTLGLYMGVNHDIGRDLFGVLLLEIRRENFRNEYRDTLVTDTTVRLRPNDVPLVSTVPGSGRTSGVRYEPALMIGPRLDLRRETFNLVLQPLAGVTHMEHCTPASNRTPRQCGTQWRAVQWDITFELEAAKSGVKLGGEVRGFQADAPDILVYLAKEFSIEKFAEFLVGPKK